MRNAIKKWRDSAGFTLAEMLLAVMILLMASAIVAMGVPSAKNAYERVVLASNAEVLLSTTISTLRSELSAVGDLTIRPTATIQRPVLDEDGNVKLDAENKPVTEPLDVTHPILYYNKTTNARSALWIGGSAIDAGAQTIKYQRFCLLKDDFIAVQPSPVVDLLSPETSTPDLYVKYDSVEYNTTSDVLTFKGLAVYRRAGGNALASRKTFSVRVLKY